MGKNLLMAFFNFFVLLTSHRFTQKKDLSFWVVLFVFLFAKEVNFVRMRTAAVVLFLAFLFLGLPECQGAYYYVNPNVGADTNMCTEPQYPCQTLARAIQAAQNGGDSILMSSGTYVGTGNRDLIINKAFNFLAADDADPPVISLDAGGWFAKWDTDYLEDTTQVASFSDIKFESGLGSDYDPSFFQIMGGSSLTFNNCNFSSGLAEHGAAILVGAHDEDLSAEQPTLVSVLNCKFTSNSANQGPAVKVFPGRKRAILVYGSTFESNTAVDGNGGAIYTGDNVILSVANSVFDSNTASDGMAGAIYSGESEIDSQITITSSQFTGNTGAGKGGALVALGGTLSLDNVTFQQNEVTAGDGGQYGGGLFTSGVLHATNCTFRSNSCPIQGSTAVSHGGGALYIHGSGSSFIRGGNFDSNSCFYGSDFASDTETTTIIDGAQFNSEEYNDGDFQILTSGNARFNDCNFYTSGDSNLIRSIGVQDSGLVALSYTKDVPVNMTVEVLYLDQDCVFQTPTNLDIKDMGSRGGTIESTTNLLTTLEATVMDLRQGTTTITGFSVVTPIGGTFINDGGLALTKPYTNRGSASFHAPSFIRTVGAAEVLVHNEGEMDANGALFSCDFLNHENATLKLPQVSNGTVPLTIAGVATLDGNLTVIVDSSGVKTYDAGVDLPLITYHTLGSDRFIEASVKNVSNSELVYGTIALSLHKGSGGGLSGGAVAGIIIGVTIALGVLTFGAWFVFIRPQTDNLEEAYQQAAGEGGPSEGYGAV